MTIPTLEQARKIWKETTLQCDISYPKYVGKYALHTEGVADAAKAIADYLNLDSQKAYIFGLLHDVGKKVNEFEVDKFHGQTGAEYMLSLGYDEVAKICLTHTFPDKDFNYIGFESYPKKWLDWAKENLKKYEYDCFDRIIQFCDMICDADGLVKIEDRTSKIIDRYNLSQEAAQYLRANALKLRDYFNDKCHCNIYKILGIE